MNQEIPQKIQSLLDEISAVPLGVADLLKGRRVQKTLSQSQSRLHGNRLIEEGVIDSVTGKFNIEKPLPILPLEWHIEYVYLQGESVRMADYIVAAKYTQVKQLCDGLVSNFLDGNALIAMMCARALIENIAIFSDTIESLAKHESSIDLPFEDVQKIQQTVGNFIDQRAHPTKLNWKDIENSFDKSKKITAPSYSAAPLVVDLTAPNILKFVDGLSKKVKSTRIAYDVLSEFVHPNAGGIMAVLIDFGKQTDLLGIEWVHTKLDDEYPTAFVRDSEVLLVRVFGVIKECLEHFNATVEQFFSIERSRLLIRTKIMVEHVLTVTVHDGNKDYDLRHIIEPYGDCPCGSESKFKFCCKI